MWLLKIKILAVLAAVLAVALAAGFVAYKSGLYKTLLAYGPGAARERVVITSALMAMKEINRLYTGSYMVPVLDISYSNGSLKHDLLSIFPVDLEPSKRVPKGYCLKKFDVGFGYDNVLDLLQDETVMSHVCAGNPAALPKPKLLSVNSKTTEINGDYTGFCRDLDQNQDFRRAAIHLAQQGEAIKKINENGQKSLYALASLLCQ